MVTPLTSDGAEKNADSSRIVSVPITGAGGDHVFQDELACTEAEQVSGLMFRTDLVDRSAMLFAPYPPDGSGGGDTPVTPPVSAVPEPSTWLMTILGFFATGTGLRRRCKGTVARRTAT